jgi:hypothetical protein
VPIKCDATIEVAHPVFNNFLGFSAKGSKEVFEIVIADILHSEIVEGGRLGLKLAMWQKKMPNH